MGSPFWLPLSIRQNQIRQFEQLPDEQVPERPSAAADQPIGSPTETRNIKEPGPKVLIGQGAPLHPRSQYTSQICAKQKAAALPDRLGKQSRVHSLFFLFLQPFKGLLEPADDTHVLSKFLGRPGGRPAF